MAVLPTMTASAVLPAASSKNSVIGTSADAEAQTKARGMVRDIVRGKGRLNKKILKVLFCRRALVVASLQLHAQAKKNNFKMEATRNTENLCPPRAFVVWGGWHEVLFRSYPMDSQRHTTESMMPMKRQCPLIPGCARMQESYGKPSTKLHCKPFKPW